MKEEKMTTSAKFVNQDTVLGSAKRVFRIEADALATMAQKPPQGFASAVARILDAQGRVVVSGMGKSGHVARKIAATLASTGTSALFVHPAEASHGDLGMIGHGDICLLLSNSGETGELSDLIRYTKRFEIPMIAITREAHSTLAKASDIALFLPDSPEACAIGMAPTTSATCALALGDALAVALMELRGFVADDFYSFHPGGKLGAQLSQVQEVMHNLEKVPLVSGGTVMSEVILVMTAGGFGVAGVVDAEGNLVGVVSDGDLRRNMEGLLERTAGEVCTRHPVTITPDAIASEALAQMNKTKVGALFVCCGGRPIGILHVHDLLRMGAL